MAHPDGPNLEPRVIRLEENNYFLEERLKALDGQVLAQQQKLDTLEKELGRLGRALLELRGLLEGKMGAPGSEPPPPHWQSTFWHDS